MLPTACATRSDDSKASQASVHAPRASASSPAKQSADWSRDIRSRDGYNRAALGTARGYFCGAAEPRLLKITVPRHPSAQAADTLVSHASPAQCYWPIPVTDPPSVAALIAAYKALGYEVCSDAKFEFLWERVIIYAHMPDEYTHAARQLPDGRWTSKLGEGIDLTHRIPEDLAGPLYGQPVQTMKKRLSFSDAWGRYSRFYLDKLAKSIGFRFRLTA